MTEQLYFDDPLTLEFTAEVGEIVPLNDSKFGAVLPRTYFYPTSGGQDHDTGTIGAARVLDVYKQGGDILHVLDKSLSPGSYPAKIDAQRRRLAMQHHTAQHILSASFLKALEIESISANINGGSPSTVDIQTDQLSSDDITRVEDFANGILFENRAVKSYYVNDEQALKIPFRKAPKVSGRIRVVEVDNFDYTPCGGTHCPNTGMVGLLKIVKTERINKKLRVHFVAGGQALGYFQDYQRVLQESSSLLESGITGIAEAIAGKLERLKQAEIQLEALHSDRLAAEAAQLIDSAQTLGDRILITALFRYRPAVELRQLANRLRKEKKLVAVLAVYDGLKLSLITICGRDTDLDARDLLQKQLGPLKLKGGGDGSLAQGGGAVNEELVGDLFKNTREYLDVA